MRKGFTHCRWSAFFFAAAYVAAACWNAKANAERATGLDISAWQGNISQTTWNNIHNVENRAFVVLRSSRGGTTGYYNQNDSDNSDGLNTLSQRYDDPYFIQNINRATTAGMFAGAYHFSRPDVIATTLNSNGIANSGADEANHFMQMAGPWMRPGYLLPVHDLEAGQSQRTSTQLSQFTVDFSNRIYEALGIRPMVYTGQNYANYINSTVPAAYPDLWIARWPQGSGQPFTGDLQTDNPPPAPSTANVYGKWNPNFTVANPYPDGHPWTFWQYGSGERLQSFNNGGSNLDGDVANGGVEFLKDKLVPALWMNDSSGDWSTLTNWNSGQTATLPVPGAGQVAPVGTLTMPTPRLPGAAGSGVTSGQHDTVILDRPNANITVTLSTGTHSVRKLLARETLNITGGSLSVNFDPATWDSPLVSTLPVSAQFSSAVALGGSGSLNVHTLQVDAARTFTLSGGTLALKTLNLMPGATPASLLINGNVNLSPFNNAAAEIANGVGAGSSGFVSLGGAERALNIVNGTSPIDLAINVPVTNGSLTKLGAGTLSLNGLNTYAGDTKVQAGQLRLGTASLADAANVYLSAGATLDLGFNGNADAVHGLYFDGVPQAPGIWGAVGSGAQFTSPLLTGTGWLSVATVAPPQPPGPAGNAIDTFEVDEGHFNWNYNLSPISQTFGLARGPANSSGPTDRVTTEHQGSGAASQLINLTIDAAGDNTWQLRHNSGITSAAQPAGNLALPGTGYVGFWLKTDDPGNNVRIAIDDPVPAGTTAIEMGDAKNIIADNQWHLYQWNFGDANDWNALGNAGSDGDIDATSGTVTIDSIWFAGAGNVQIYMDNVMHNPNGLITPGYIPGDFNGDGLVGGADYTAWRNSYGQSVAPWTGADGNGDGVVNNTDYVLWRRQMSLAGSGLGAGAAVPEPSTVVALAIATLALAIRRRPLAA